MEIAFERLSVDANNWLKMQMDIFFEMEPNFKWVHCKEDGKLKFKVFSNSKKNFIGVDQTYDPDDADDAEGEFLLYSNGEDYQEEIKRAVKEYGWSVWQKTVEQQYMLWHKAGQWGKEGSGRQKIKSVVRTLPYYGPTLYLVCGHHLMIRRVPEEFVCELLVAQTEKTENVIHLSHLRHSV